MTNTATIIALLLLTSSALSTKYTVLQTSRQGFNEMLFQHSGHVEVVQGKDGIGFSGTCNSCTISLINGGGCACTKRACITIVPSETVMCELLTSLKDSGDIFNVKKGVVKAYTKKNEWIQLIATE